MIYLTARQVTRINADLVGEALILDAGLIESACGRPQATAFGSDAYPGIWEKAAALLQSLACNHCFADGNKRTAWAAVTAFLTVNGHPLDPAFSVREADELVLAVATGGMRGVQPIASALVKFFDAGREPDS